MRVRRLGRWALVLLLAGLFACTTEASPPSAVASGTGGARDGGENGSGGTTGGTGGEGGANVRDAALESSPPIDVADAPASEGTVATSDASAMTDSRPASDGAAEASDAGQVAPDADAATLPARVLLYHFSTIVIDTVPAQLTFLKNKLTEWGFETEDSVDPSKFTDANLMRYAAVAMVNTCFEPFGAGKPDRPSSEALQRFVQRGGGLFGTHCAAVTFANAQPPALYNQLFGGRGGNGFFDGRSDCRKTADHVTSAALPATWVFNGNLDNADFVATDSVVLVRCTWSTGKDVAVSWYRNDGAGRVFYTNFAKLEPDLRDPVLGAGHVVPGLAWVLKR